MTEKREDGLPVIPRDRNGNVVVRPERPHLTSSELEHHEPEHVVGGAGPALHTGELGMHDTAFVLTPLQVITRWATAEELEGLATLITERRARRPAFTYWVCTKCGWRAKSANRDEQPGATCLACNRQDYQDGGHMRSMTPKEVKKYEEDMAAQAELDVARMAENRRLAAERYRLEHGVGPSWTPAKK